MTLHQAIFLFLSALGAGALNSVAGGGSFISFPALLFTGMLPIPANATNTTALWPGTLASAAAYRREIAGNVRSFLPLMVTAVAGGIVGAVILLHTPQPTFMKLIPYLLLSATLLLAFSDHVTRWIGSHALHASGPSRKAVIGGALAQMAIAIYIGFFGAGAGILMMALFAIMGVQNIHALNGMKTLMATVTNGVAVVTFIIAGAIVWPQAIIMLVGAAIGGYGGAWYAQRLNPRNVRRFAIFTGAAMTVYFFIRTTFLS